MLQNLLDGMYERRSWLIHEIKRLNDTINDPDVDNDDAIINRIHGLEAELANLEDKIDDFHNTSEE